MGEGKIWKKIANTVVRVTPFQHMGTGNVLFVMRNGMKMKVFVNTEFKGHWPAGSAAVVVADSRHEAAVILRDSLGLVGLDQDIQYTDMLELDIDSKAAYILCDGNY